MRSLLDSCRSISLKLYTEGPTDCTRMAAALLQKYQMAMSPESSKTLVRQNNHEQLAFKCFFSDRFIGMAGTNCKISRFKSRGAFEFRLVNENCQ